MQEGTGRTLKKNNGMDKLTVDIMMMYTTKHSFISVTKTDPNMVVDVLKNEF